MSEAVDKYIHDQKQRGLWFEAPKWSFQCAKMAEHQQVINTIKFNEHQAEVLNNHRKDKP